MIVKKVSINSADKMMKLGQSIGRTLKGGECIELISDVGGGKTTFTRGLAKGAGSQDHVSSPTFTISKVYRGPKFTIVHFDFYRLKDAGLIEHEIEEAVFEPSTVVVVEWSSVVSHVLPDDRLQIKIETDRDDTRNVTVSCPAHFAYILERVK